MVDAVGFILAALIGFGFGFGVGHVIGIALPKIGERLHRARGHLQRPDRET